MTAPFTPLTQAQLERLHAVAARVKEVLGTHGIGYYLNGDPGAQKNLQDVVGILAHGVESLSASLKEADASIALLDVMEPREPDLPPEVLTAADKPMIMVPSQEFPRGYVDFDVAATMRLTPNVNSGTNVLPTTFARVQMSEEKVELTLFNRTKPIYRQDAVVTPDPDDSLKFDGSIQIEEFTIERDHQHLTQTGRERAQATLTVLLEGHPTNVETIQHAMRKAAKGIATFLAKKFMMQSRFASPPSTTGVKNVTYEY